MKQRKLINKTLYYYLGYGLLMALFVVMAFYLLMGQYHTHEIDEFLFMQRDKVVQKSLRTLKVSEIPVWNQFNMEEIFLSDTEQLEDNVFTTEYIYSEYEKKYEPHRVLYSRVEIEGEKYILAIRLSVYEARKILLSSSLLQLLLFVCMIASLTIITRLIYGKLWKPFYQTLSLTEQFNIQKNEVLHFPLTDTQEFNQLNRVLETLIHNNVQAYKIQKEFTENASHEMQTPLAVFRSKLDLLLQQPDLTEEQMEIILTLHQENSRLVRMNKNLLLLAKMDNLQFLDTQTLNISDLLEELLPFLLEQTEAANITLETQISNRTLTLQANKVLLESLFNNLLTNAIRHNVPGGKILVKLEANHLETLNTGVGQPLDSTLLFRRFGRMNSAAKGSGLGLAIVRQICSFYGWEIDYSFAEEMHRFEITFTSISII